MVARILIGLAFLLVFFGVLETLTFRSLSRAHGESAWWGQAKVAWWSLHVVIWAMFLAAFFMWPTWRGTHPVLLKTIMSITFAVTLPKMFVAAIQLVDEVRALIVWLAHRWQGGEEAGMDRGSFLNQLAQAVGLLSFGAMTYGIVWGKYAYRVREHRVIHPKVPEAFDGLRVVQLSDAHLGSFDGTPEPVLEALKQVQGLKPDLILFTGDLVNELADEAEAWVDAFAALSAPLGKYSVMEGGANKLETEQEREQEQEQQKEVKARRDQQVEIEKFVDREYSRNEESPTPWHLRELFKPPSVDLEGANQAWHPFYPL